MFQRVLLLFLVLHSGASAAADREIVVKFLFQSIVCNRGDEDIDNCEKYTPDGPYINTLTMKKVYEDADIIQYASQDVAFFSKVDGLVMKAVVRVVSTLGKIEAGYNMSQLNVSFWDHKNKRNTKAVTAVTTLEGWNSAMAVFGRPHKRGKFDVFPQFILMPEKFLFTSVSR